MTNGQKKRRPTEQEIKLAENESKFVDETGFGVTIDNSEAEGEPFDFGLDNDDNAEDSD